LEQVSEQEVDLKYAAFLILLACAAAFSRDMAVVDSKRVFDTLGSVRDARELLEEELDKWQAHADSLQQEVDEIRADLERTMVMSPERRMEREALLVLKEGNLQRFLSDVFSPGGLLERRNEQLVAPIVAAINEAVREIATEEGLSLVLDSSSGHVVFADPALDITDLVIDRVAAGGRR
jgi:outer membrane protein